MNHTKFALMFVLLLIVSGAICRVAGWPLINAVLVTGIVTMLAGAWMASQWRGGQ